MTGTTEPDRDGQVPPAPAQASPTVPAMEADDKIGDKTGNKTGGDVSGETGVMPPRSVQPPWTVRQRRAFAQAWVLFWRHDGLSAAGNLAFLAMLSLFPFLIFFVSVSGFLGQTERGLAAVAFFLSVLPPEVTNVLEGPINGIIRNTGAELLTGSVLFALWTATSGLEAARGIVIRLFGRRFAPAMWRRRLESFGVVIGASILLIAAMTMLVIAPALERAILALFPEIITGGLTLLFDLIRLAVSPALLLAALYGIYLALTPRRAGAAVRLPGTLLALLVFLGTARGMSVYLTYAGSYDVTYGSLAGVVVAQLFCFLVSLGFIFGAALNAAYSRPLKA